MGTERPVSTRIPEIFRLYNNVNIMNQHFIDREMYTAVLVPNGFGADQCTKCENCIKYCTQGLNIPAKLEEVHKYLAA
jgi:hypothetical protein